MSKVGQNSTAFKKQTDCFSVFYLDVTCIRAFLNDLCQVRGVYGFEDIGQSRFHANIFSIVLAKKNVGIR